MSEDKRSVSGEKPVAPPMEKQSITITMDGGENYSVEVTGHPSLIELLRAFSVVQTRFLDEFVAAELEAVRRQRVQIAQGPLPIGQA